MSVQSLLRQAFRQAQTSEATRDRIPPVFPGLSSTAQRAFPGNIARIFPGTLQYRNCLIRIFSRLRIAKWAEFSGCLSVHSLLRQAFRQAQTSEATRERIPPVFPGLSSTAQRAFPGNVARILNAFSSFANAYPDYTGKELEKSWKT